ncbi:unnamed protein product [Linum tenue]|uniref:Uncharacterized protein n=1 Tax=Linum tenue TaxID=586396 RepID=A0AAV0I1Z5_9ROSI|nr:unnamed protein product [Linum tenue]
MYFNGLYHLFYQYNPKGSVWGNIVWAHSVSKDLINWQALEPAIEATKPFDIKGCWSGSATILPGNKPVILYTGVDKHNRQVQDYAVPTNLSDPYLRSWVKPSKGNPFINPDRSVNASAFRDPTTAWFVNGEWHTVVGSKRDMVGVAYLYTSKDFKKWVRAKEPLHSARGTGMWECPDFYPVSPTGRRGLDTSALGKEVKHVFKVSLDLTRFDYYTIGKHRRVLWGWANESDGEARDKDKGWAGIQLIPRKVWLDPSGKQLLQWPIEELEKLRSPNPRKLSSKVLRKGQYVEVDGTTAAQADVVVTFSFRSLDRAEPFDPKWADIPAQDVCHQKGSTVPGGLGPFGLLTVASEKLEEFTPVMFRVFKKGGKHVVLFCSDATSSSLAKGLYKPSFAGYVDVDVSKTKKISLRSLIDHSVVESFAEGGKTVISSRVYPTLATGTKARLFLF